ncbi:hypothetical protein KKG56_04920, partial [bacterium]|nr:hypothetical protein [bacterium]
MKIYDLIQVPPIKTVIQLSETESCDCQQLIELLNTFVITEETGHNLRVVLQSIAEGTTSDRGVSLQSANINSGTPSSGGNGCGIFLQGHYGTGKSHFLSFLSVLLEHEWAWDAVVPVSGQAAVITETAPSCPSPAGVAKGTIFEEFRQLRDNRYLVTKIPLQHYSAAHTLEDIVFGGVERQFNRVGERDAHAEMWRRGGDGVGVDLCVYPQMDRVGDQSGAAPARGDAFAISATSARGATSRAVVIARVSRLLNNFNHYVLPRHPDFLSSLGMGHEQWQEIVHKSPDDACQMAVRYLESLETLPIRLEYERDDAFKKIWQYKIDYGYDGLVLILDELSEFLRAKSTPASFNEDVRFLQHLGEEAANKPLWIIASLQEQIEETGHIQQNLFNRIKDR